jgi:plasmid stabilization system protein ParE
MRVRYTETALAEIDHIIEYVAQENVIAAAKVSAAIERSISWIERWPRTPPVVHTGGVRAKLVTGYQYRIFYTVDGDEVVLRNVRSTRQLRPWEDVPP